MKVLVTGSSGFIGTHVVGALFADGHDVTGIDVKESPTTNVRTDLSDCRHVGSALDDDFEAIVHLAAWGGVARAAREPLHVFGGNVDATAVLVAKARRMKGLRRVVLASSFSVYGQCYPVKDDSPMAPLEAYAASKLGQELAFVGSGLPLATFRFSSVYGRGMRLADNEATILAKIAGWLSRGEDVTIFEDGHQTRDFVHVSDVVDSIRRAVKWEAPWDLAINVCSGVGTSLLQATDTLRHVIGSKSKTLITGETRPGDMRHCLGDPARMVRLIGREPTSFAMGAIDAFAGLG